MVLGLCEHMAIPRSERNAMLLAAGFAPTYIRRDWSDPELAPVKQMMMQLMRAHEPAPALLVDRHWVLVDANRPAMTLAGALGLQIGDSLIDALCEKDLMVQIATNPAEVAAHFMARLRGESQHAGGDAVLDRAANRLAEQWPEALEILSRPLAPFIPVRLASPLGQLSFISLIAELGSAEDLFLADLKVELLFPADDETRMRLQELAATTE